MAVGASLRVKSEIEREQFLKKKGSANEKWVHWGGKD